MTQATTDTPSAIIARQAIVNSDRVVVGYELFDRSHSNGLHTAASDVTLIFNALSHAGTEEVIGKLQLFINCTPSSLAGGHLDLVQPEKFTLEIPPVEDADASLIEGRTPVLTSLRERGFQLAFEPSVLEDAYQPWIGLADYIKFDLSALPAEQLKMLVRRAQNLPGVDLVAEKVETLEQFEACKAMGFGLFQGYWFARPSVVATRLIAPSQLAAVELVNLIRRQASTDEIELVLKKDAGLAFNLMRLINSAGFGMQREVTSFRHAVMILGLNKLLRWAAMLMTTPRDGSPPALGTTAVVRGRLMELLAAEIMSPEEADNAFVVGIFSLLDSMLGMPLDKALEAVSLPQPVTDALLRKTGAFAPLLALTEACETANDVVFAEQAIAPNLSNHQVNWAHLNALAWADDMASAG